MVCLVFSGRVLLRLDRDVFLTVSFSAVYLVSFPFLHFAYLIFFNCCCFAWPVWLDHRYDVWENCFLTYYNWNVTVTFCSSSETTTKQTPEEEEQQQQEKHTEKYAHENREKTRILLCNAKWFRCKVTENEDKLHAMHTRKVRVTISTGTFQPRMQLIDTANDDHHTANKIQMHKTHFVFYSLRCFFAHLFGFSWTLADSQIRIRAIGSRWIERIAWFNVIFTFARYIWQNSL